MKDVAVAVQDNLCLELCATLYLSSSSSSSSQPYQPRYIYNPLHLISSPHLGFSLLPLPNMQPPHLLLHLFLCLLPSLSLIPAVKPDLTSDKASLLALRSSLAGRTIELWNASHQTPCSWTGVKCQGSRVTVLRLPGASLSGQIPTGIFRNLTHLRTLSLRLNALTGQLPSDLAACTNLRSLYLQGNKGTGRTPLNWEMRRAIACGAARGIKYLHSQGPNVSHGNIKSSNILLAKSYDARVSDFGLAQLVGPASSPNRVVGYRAPEVTDSRKVSQKADVYSFGVLLLELLTGKAPSHAVLNEEGVDLPRWVQSVLQEEWRSEVFDAELLRYESVEEEMVKMLELAVDCAAQHPDRRPSMYEVSSRIEELCSPSAHSNPQQHNVGAADKPFGTSTSHIPNAKSI